MRKQDEALLGRSWLIRFNGVGGFNPHFPNRAVGEMFECTDLVFARGGNRVLFRRRVAKSCRPDYFLSVVSSGRFGALRFEDSARSASPTPIAVSHIGEEQEAMLLMKPGDRVRAVSAFCNSELRQICGMALHCTCSKTKLSTEGTDYALRQRRPGHQSGA